MAVQVKKNSPLFLISGVNTSYAIGWDEKYQALRHLYWGKRVEHVEDFEFPPLKELSANDSEWDIMFEEYAPWGGRRFKTPSIKASFADGTRDIVFSLLKHEIHDDVLSIHLKDRHYNFFVTLYYQMSDEQEILSRWVEVKNEESEDVFLETIASASFHIPQIELESTQVKGHWAGEQQLFIERLFPGKKVYESRKGTTSHNHSPYFILSKDATESAGEVFFGALGYSGNFKVSIDVTPYDATSVSIGVNDFDFSLRLKPGRSFVSPKVYAGYTDKGFSDMSNRMNQFAMKNILPEQTRGKIRKVLYNSWEATEFDISVEQQVMLAKKAADLGVELFVMDDGWFGKRNGDSAGLGDWYPNKEKFPNGLAELVTKVNELGMDFGIWVEPEMVNEDSELYRKHPDWIYHFAHREPTKGRNQLVLDLTRTDVQEYLITSLDKLLSESNITFVKWDMNRPISEPGASQLDKADQKSMWYLHSMAVYKIVDTLRKKHPNVLFEACSSGGGRVDYGAMEHFDQFWPSDNTDALDRLFIQEGYSMLYPIKAMYAWVTDVPNGHTKKTIPLEFRLHAAMMGPFGLGVNLLKSSETDLSLIKEKVAEYKSVRKIIQEGEFYRLASLRHDALHAVQYVLDKKDSVIFIFQRGQHYVPASYIHHVRLRGLDPDARYMVTYRGESVERNGDFLMGEGISVPMLGDYQSGIISLKKGR